MNGGFSISFDIAGERQLSRRIHGLIGAMSDWTPVWKTLQADWSATMLARFSSEGAHEGQKWAPLSEAYARWKRKHYPGANRILYRTGALQMAAAMPETTMSPTRLEMSVDVPYAIYHQSAEPRSIMPRRAFASFSAQQKTRWVRAFNEHIRSEGNRLRGG
jgi:hypothetical protein